MISGCESCKYAVYDSVPYGMGSTSYLSGCRLEDKMGEELSEEEIDLIMDPPHPEPERALCPGGCFLDPPREIHGRVVGDDYR